MISEQHQLMASQANSGARMTRRNFLQQTAALGIGGSAALTLLNACGSPLASSGTHVTYWNLFGGGDGVRMVQMENNFSQSHPNINLEAVTLAWGAPYYTKLAMAAAGGRPPDVAISHMTRVPIYASENLLDPFDIDELARYGITEDKFLPAIWQRAHYNGKLYTIPLDTHPFVLYYNTDICQKAGLLNADGSLKPLNSPEVLMDAFKRAQQVTGPGTFGLAAEAQAITAWRLFYTLYSQLGGEVLSADGKTLTMDDTKAEQVLSFMADLTLKSKVASPFQDYAGAVALFGSGKAAFHWNGEWEVTTFLAQKDLHFNMAPFPQLYDTYRVQADSHAFILPHQLAVDPARRAGALEYISYMLKNSQNWAAGGHIPAYLPVTESDAYKQLKPQSNYASVAANAVLDPIAWFSGSGSELENQAGAAFQGVFTGAMTSTQALQQFKAALQKLLAIPAFN
ncbi:extracellular solute-binding protein [Dictyobacter arantiisoli]|uniref:ABC transporter substrate-binding protein n=1 Tax=Dictyobacter arantiisoli TaxID=2014874 RepID=A0A5A5TLK4_9CHLR|nr:extracellular solute-binding protein [Dictyobacter arantiisoli]GCF11884.1 ABC transporter substrate-binding protein [Dictyobacter arantiisoli]